VPPHWAGTGSHFVRAALVSRSNGANTDWPQFRGHGALGRGDATGFALHWTDDSNIVWKATLPGPGASSPIVRSDRVYLTCFTGFAASSGEPGDIANLKRHLVCLNLADGKIVWTRPFRRINPSRKKSARIMATLRRRRSSTRIGSTPFTDAPAFLPSITTARNCGRQKWETSSTVGDQRRRLSSSRISSW
jgi:hypothetical protein